MKEKVPNSVQLIDSHLDLFLDKDAGVAVFDEIESEIIHRDIYFIYATEDRPYHILLSCGMSALPMTVPEDVDSPGYVEVMMLLPKEWSLEYESFSDEKNYWPIRIMKEIMMLPHSDNTWLGYGHTYTHDEGEEFAEGLGFNSVMLAYSQTLSDDFTHIEREDGKVVEVFTLVPLYNEELEFKIKNSTSELLELFDQFNIEEVIQIGRRNVCKQTN